MATRLKTIITVCTILIIVITISATYFTATQKPLYKPVRFLRQEVVVTYYGVESEKIPYDLAASLKPLPPSFEMSRRFGWAHDWEVHSVNFWTVLREGEVIQLGFNSSYPVAIYLGSSPDMGFHETGTSYYGTLKVPQDGVYCFIFDFDNPGRLVAATVSFRCFEPMNRAAINQPWYDDLIQ